MNGGNMIVQRVFSVLVCSGALLCGAPDASAQPGPVPIPAVESGSAYQNLFLGAVPKVVGSKAPVLVFIHGLRGRVGDWWEDNDVYQMVYHWGYRSAYIGLSADNSRNDASIEANAAVIRELLPKIAKKYGVSKLYVITHSKGGLDMQFAMLDPLVASLTKAVFMISTPNQGTELSDWAFAHPEVAGPMGLLTPGVASMRLAPMKQFRASMDPILQSLGIPFYTMTGNHWADNPLTLITGAVLVREVGLQNNDGFVTVERSRLSANFSADLGVLPAHHFQTDNGSVSFPKINARIQGMETSFEEFERIATNGFAPLGGNPHNSWAWSMQWFKGKLYVGTGTEVTCMSVLASDVQAGSNFYVTSVLTGQCPDGRTIPFVLAAEIWQYTPETRVWKRVYKSPEDVPIAYGPAGAPAAFTARDTGYRGMAVHVEPDGTEALYVGGVTSGSIFEIVPPYDTEGFPPPRLLRSVDGESFAPVPQTPGTFLGDVGKGTPSSAKKFRSFRSLVSYHGKLYSTLADFLGVGVVVASANPAAGDNAWTQVSPSYDDFPTWTLTTFNGYLYATTGKTAMQDETVPGFGVYRSDGSGTWIPVITNGGYQPVTALRAPNGLSFAEFHGQLYLGTNRPTELYRINPDDSWDLVVGEPRQLPDGSVKVPLSGMGIGFGSWFMGHFWRMGVHGDWLYLATWDWSVSLSWVGLSPLDKIFGYNHGFDMFRTRDGVHWTAVTQTGLGDPFNYGGRSFQSTPFGLFLGTARQRGGLQVFQSQGPDESPLLAPPQNLRAASQYFVGRNVNLSWEPSAGAVRYRVYRATVKTLNELVGSAAMPADQAELTALIADVKAGKYDSVCPLGAAPSAPCEALTSIKQLLNTDAEEPLPLPDAFPNPTAFPLPYGLVTITTNPTYAEPAPSALQSLYFVRAEDAQGNLSKPSNLVGGPSKFLNGSPPIAVCQSVTVECTAQTCMVPASIDAGSYDPDGDAIALAQTPAGPYEVGTTRVTLTVKGPVASAACVATVTVIDAHPPVFSSALTSVVKPNDPARCTAEVALMAPEVRDNAGVASLTNDAPAVFPVGTTTVTWRATDTSGNLAMAMQRVTVVDKEAPRIAGFRADRTELWPPDHKLVPVKLAYTLVDNCAATEQIKTKLRVESSEDAREHGKKAEIQWHVVSPFLVRLLAAHLGHAHGRIYRLTLWAEDPAGNVDRATIRVRVPIWKFWWEAVHRWDDKSGSPIQKEKDKSESEDTGGSSNKGRVKTRE